MLWDIVDIGFVVLDIKGVIEDPSLENLAWATLSVISLAPLLPNVAAYIRYGDKAVDVGKSAIKADKAKDATRAVRELTTGEIRAMEKIDNIIADHLTDADISAAVREMKGQVVKYKSNGKPFNHVKEVLEAKQGLRNQIKNLEKSLKKGKLSVSDEQRINSEIQKAKSKLNEVDKLVPDNARANY